MIPKSAHPERVRANLVDIAALTPALTLTLALALALTLALTLTRSPSTTSSWLREIDDLALAASK